MRVVVALVTLVVMGRTGGTPDVVYCFEDQDVAEAARLMKDKQIRRLVVLNRDKRLVGIVSLGDVARTEGGDTVGDAVVGVSQPGGAHKT